MPEDNSGGLRSAKRRVVYLYSSQPITLDRQKLEALHSMENLEVHLVYWDRLGWSLRFPFATALPASQVHVLSRPSPRGSMAGRAFERYRVLKWMVQTAADLGPAVVHACSADNLLAARLVARRGHGTRVVYDLQDTPDWMWKAWSRVPQRLLLGGVDLMFVTSPRFETEFARALGLLPAKVPVCYVPNVPKAEVFESFVASPPGESFGIGLVGGIREEGPLRALLGAVDRLNEEGLPVRLVVAGVGPFKGVVEEAARSRSYVHFLGPYDYDRDITQIYSRVHLIHACYRESPDRKIHLACRFADAVNCGLPIVVGEGTYMAQLVQRHGHGVSASPEGVSSLADALRPMIRNRERWMELAANARALRNEFVFEHYLPRFRTAYAGLLG